MNDHRDCHGETGEERKARLQSTGEWDRFQRRITSLKKEGVAFDEAYRKAAGEFSSLPSTANTYDQPLQPIGRGNGRQRTSQSTRSPRAPGWSALPLMTKEQAESKTASSMQAMQWAADHLGVDEITPEDAPSSMAWEIYRWASQNEQNRTAFWTRWMPNQKQIETESRYQDHGEGVEELINQFIDHRNTVMMADGNV